MILIFKWNLHHFFFIELKKFIFHEVFNFDSNKQALHIAVEKGNLEVVRLLLERKDIEVNTKSILKK